MEESKTKYTENLAHEWNNILLLAFLVFFFFTWCRREVVIYTKFATARRDARWANLAHTYTQYIDKAENVEQWY